MKKVIVSAILIAILISCGGPSDPTLSTAKLEIKGKRFDSAYNKLSEGLYSDAGKKEALKKIPEAWFEMAKLHKRKDEILKASMCLDKASEFDVKGEWISKITNTKVRWAGIDYKTGISSYNKAISLKDASQTMLLKKAETLLTSSNIFNEQSYVYSVLGKTQTMLGDNIGAEKSYVKAIALEDTNANIRFDLASFYYNNKEYEYAVVAFNNTLNLDPKHKNALKFKAFSLQNDQKLDLAVKAYKALLDAYPDDKDGNDNLKMVEAHHISTQANELINKFNDLRNSKKKKAKSYLTECATLLETAVATEMHKENAVMWGTLSIVYANLGKAKKAKHADKMSTTFSKN